MREHMVSLEKVYGLSVLDMDMYFKSTFNKPGEFESLYSDGAHYIRPSVTTIVANRLALHLNIHLSKEIEGPDLSSITLLGSDSFTNAQIALFDDILPESFERVTFKNSRYCVKAVRVDGSQVVTLKNVGALISVSYVSSSDSGQLIVEESGENGHRICTHHKRVGDGSFPFLLKTTPLSRVDWPKKGVPGVASLSLESKDSINSGIFRDSTVKEYNIYP